MATITIQGQTLYYTRPMKAKDGPTLLLIHGAGGDHLIWPREIQRLPGTAVYNLDLPGHGRSDGPGRSTVDGYADIVQEFIEKLALQDVTLIGHSMGGAIAQALALRMLPQVIRMIILNSSARLRVSPELLQWAVADPESAADFVVQTSWGSEAPAALADLGKKSMLQIESATLHGDFLACDSFDVRQELREINIPTLVISGSEDKMTPLRFGQYLAEHLVNARLIVIEGAGHFAMLQSPGEVADAISQFLGLG